MTKNRYRELPRPPAYCDDEQWDWWADANSHRTPWPSTQDGRIDKAAMTGEQMKEYLDWKKSNSPLYATVDPVAGF